MQLNHSFTVPADPETTWATFMDLEGVAGCFPGAVVTGVDGDSFTGTVKVKLGPIALQYAGQGHFVERDDATKHAVIAASGKDKRGNGTAGATATITVSDGVDGGSSVEVVTDLNVTGKPAQFGRGVMQDVSDKLLGQFVACLEHRFTAEEAPAEAAAEPAAEAGEAAAGAGAAVTSGSSAAPATDVPDATTPAPAPSAADAATSGSSAAPATDVPDATTPAPATSGTSAAPATGIPDATTAAPAATTPAPAPAAARPAPRVTPPQFDNEALDLGSAVVPILLRTYGPYVVVLVVGIVIGWLIRR